MTICVAAICRWNYATEPTDPLNMGPAIITASDRMITIGGTEYEPTQAKFGQITRSVMVLVAGDTTTHSHAIKVTKDQVRPDSSASPYNVATIYGSAIQSVRRKQAEDIILAPLALNTDIFLAQQKDMSDFFVDGIKTQMQNFEGPEVEALVVGIEGDLAHIYEVDRYGTVRCYDDSGFAAIGIGGIHARTRMMQAGYVNFLPFNPALATVFAAKKTAEVAPGVGKTTDIVLVTRHGIKRIEEIFHEKLEEFHKEYVDAHQTLAWEIIGKLERWYREENQRTADVANTNSKAAGSGPKTSSEHTAEGSDQLQGKEPQA